MKILTKKNSMILLGLLLLIAAFFIISGLQQKKETAEHEKEFLAEIQGQYEKINKGLFVVSGEFVCLPVKDENIPHNDLCLFGIKTDNDDYYRLQAPSDDPKNVVNKIKIGQKIEIGGELVNEESDVYQTLGTIKVKAVKHLDL